MQMGCMKCDDSADAASSMPALDPGTLHLGCTWEAQFWASEARSYTAWDVAALLYTVIVNSMLLRVFRHNGHAAAVLPITFQFALYIVCACLQLFFIFRRPAVYKKHRYGISAVNRLVRLLLLALSTCVNTAAAAAGFVNTMTSTASDSVFVLSSAGMVRLLRVLLAHPIGYLSMANYIIPFRFAMPVQLATLGLVLVNARSQACVFHSAADMRAPISTACISMSRCMAAAGVVISGPSLDVSELLGPRQLCSSDITASLLLILYAHIVIVVLLPCFVLYQVERSLKAKFVKQQQQPLQGVQGSRRLSRMADFERELQRTGPIDLLATLFAVTCTLAACWFACAALIALLPPLACDAGGWLTAVRQT